MIPLQILGQVGGFLQANWKFFMALFVVIGCYMYITGLQDQIIELNDQHTADVAAFATLTETCKTNEAKLTATIETQNKAIEEKNKKLQDADKRIADLVAGYKKRKQEQDRKLADLLKTPVPTTCTGAVDYLIEQGGGLQWSK